MRDDEKRMRYKVKLKAFLGENEYGGLNSIHPEVPQNYPSDRFFLSLQYCLRPRNCQCHRRGEG